MTIQTLLEQEKTAELVCVREKVRLTDLSLAKSMRSIFIARNMAIIDWIVLEKTTPLYVLLSSSL